MQCLLKLCSPLIEIIGIRLISLTLMFTLPAPSIFFCKSMRVCSYFMCCRWTKLRAYVDNIPRLRSLQPVG